MTSVLNLPVSAGPEYRIAMPGSPEYHELSRLIQSIFNKSYSADISVSYPQLLAVYDTDGRARSALGMRGAGEEKLFLERYLSQPVEQAVHTLTGITLPREKIAEAGNLASTSMISLRNLMLALSVALIQDGYDYILFTGTEGLKRYLELLGLKPVVYAPADPKQLGDEAASWGRYYDTHPKVMGGPVDEFYHGLIAAYTRRMES